MKPTTVHPFTINPCTHCHSPVFQSNSWRWGITVHVLWKTCKHQSCVLWKMCENWCGPPSSSYWESTQCPLQNIQTTTLDMDAHEKHKFVNRPTSNFATLVIYANYLTMDVTILLINGLVTTQLDYGNSLMYSMVCQRPNLGNFSVYRIRLHARLPGHPNWIISPQFYDNYTGFL